MVTSLVIKNRGVERKMHAKRMLVGVAILLLLTLVLVARLFYLQVLQQDTYSILADENRIRVAPLPPPRGLIYDRNGVLVAESAPSFNLTIAIDQIDDLEARLDKLQQMMDVSEADLKAFKKRMQHRQYQFHPVPILFGLSEEEQAKYSVNKFSMPGVTLEAQRVRYYPLGALTAHAVGAVRRISSQDAARLSPVAYAGTHYLGKTGVEKFYEQELLGKVGYQEVEVDVYGRPIRILDASSPMPGKNLILHLDTSLQQAASDALGEGRRGVVVAIEPKTGGILALVSQPSYDPNLFVAGIEWEAFEALKASQDAPLFNRAMQGQYEPGSTLKPALALIGLLTDTLDPEATIDDLGWYQIPGNPRIYRDWNWSRSNPGGHGRVDMAKAIYRSCNVYFYDLAFNLGIERINQHLPSFGFGANTMLDLPEAYKGLVPSPEWKLQTRDSTWFMGDTVNVGIGQGDLLVTPLQMATLAALIANRGHWVAPRMLKSGSDLLPESTPHQPATIKNLSPMDWDRVIGAMQQVVHRGNREYGENGTAWAYIGIDIPYRMAGKSGTAQVVGIAQDAEYDEQELPERHRKHAWFIAFAPVDDPQIALAVLVENGGGGSEVAAPVARAVLDHYLLKKQLLKKALSKKTLWNPPKQSPYVQALAPVRPPAPPPAKADELD